MVCIIGSIYYILISKCGGIIIKVNGLFSIMEEKWLNNFVTIGSGEAYK